MTRQFRLPAKRITRLATPMATEKSKETIHGADSFVLDFDRVKLAVTAIGGHMAPVIFRLGEREVAPYALAPWLPDEVDTELPVLLKNLRGDFLCLPFGAQAEGPPHGETANFEWTLLEQTDRSILLHNDPSDVRGSVKKSILLKPGHTALYVEHRIKGVEGAFSYGNHPVLDLSSLPNGGGRVTISPFHWGSVYTSLFSDPADGASQALKPGAVFSDLKAVPQDDGGLADLTRYPARPGNDDLVMMASVPVTPERPFAWSAVLFDGFVWFSLKNPRDFPCTLFWMSNGGRTAEPWNGRHTGRIGVEEVCSHFADGVEISRQDLLAGVNVPTTREFRRDEPVSLRLIQAVVEVPEGFGAVVEIVPDGAGRVTLTDESGVHVTAPVDWEFVVPEH